MTELEAAAEAWIADHRAARHLRRTRDWAVELDPAAGQDVRLAALTHDVERHVPGGPRLDARNRQWDDAEYLREHSERSARFVDEWLAARGASAELRERVGALVRAHETGGWPEADVVQAADSLSFLEVQGHRVIAWVHEGRCDVEKSRAKLEWMRDRIALARARPLAEPLFERAAAALDQAFPGAARR